jgi:hypothetical protein
VLLVSRVKCLAIVSSSVSSIVVKVREYEAGLTPTPYDKECSYCNSDM